MRTIATTALLAAATLLSADAWPCGGGFGEELTIAPSQQIVLRHSGGIETYVFRPHFCGSAAEFGLILPVPAELSASPALGDAKLFTELDELTAPIVIEERYCPSDSDREGASGGYDGSQNLLPIDDGVNVVGAGQVGIFDWALLLADTNEAFTSWLDANGFPYEPDATEQFAFYVDKGWYFVAFRVTASSSAPPAGQKLCGDLGPLTLSFPASVPVVPARIAASAGTDDYFVWQLFTSSAHQLRSVSPQMEQTLLYSATLTPETVEAYPTAGALFAPGERLTKLNLAFWGPELADDIALEDDPAERDYRAVIHKPVVDCGNGCSLGSARSPRGPASVAFGLLGANLVALAWRRRRSSRRAGYSSHTM